MSSDHDQWSKAAISSKVASNMNESGSSGNSFHNSDKVNCGFDAFVLYAEIMKCAGIIVFVVT